MITVSIPGRDLTLDMENLILDLNGTIAVDGVLIDGVKERIDLLRDRLNISILTADTFGSGKNIAEELGIKLVKVSPEIGALDKQQILNEISAETTITIGNGYNDRLMLADAALSIVVLENEGCSVKALQNADIAVKNIVDALDMLIKPARIIATLRA